MTPTQRSLKKLKDEGWIREKVERPWNPYTQRTQDLFDFGDILAFRGDVTVIVQTTSHAGNAQVRVRKIQASEIARAWLASEHRAIVVHSWRKVGPRGKKKLWECREISITV